MKTLTFARDFNPSDLNTASMKDLDDRYFHLTGLCPVSVDKNILYLAATESFSDFRMLDNLKKVLRKKTFLLRTEDEDLQSAALGSPQQPFKVNSIALDFGTNIDWNHRVLRSLYLVKQQGRNHLIFSKAFGLDSRNTRGAHGYIDMAQPTPVGYVQPSYYLHINN